MDLFNDILIILYLKDIVLKSIQLVKTMRKILKVLEKSISHFLPLMNIQILLFTVERNVWVVKPSIIKQFLFMP